MATRGRGAPVGFYWKTQHPVDYLDTTLTINTPENVVADLSGGKPCRIWSITVVQTNNTATVENIVLHVTIENPATSVMTVYDFARGAAVSATEYCGVISDDLDTGDFATSLAGLVHGTIGGVNANQAISMAFGKISLITVEQTTDVDGVSAQIEVNIAWDKLTRFV